MNGSSATRHGEPPGHAPPPVSRVDTRARPHVFVIAVHGGLDLATAPHLRRASDSALASGIADIVVDLGTVRMVDSSGLHELVRLHHRAERSGQVLTILSSRLQVRRVLALIGPDVVLPFLA